MTDKFAANTLTELAKAGVLFIVMGVAVYALWMNMQKNDQEQRERIDKLERQTELCQQENYRILMDQLSRTTEVIERNTNALTQINR